MFETPVPVVNLSGDSSRARHSKNGNPILKCRRCAKEEEERAKREGRMGCGDEPYEEEAEETSEASIDLGCKKCQDRARRKKYAQNTSIMPSGILRFQNNGMLGQVPLARTMETLWSQPAMRGAMGNGGRGGRAFSYDIDHRMEYCDPTVDPDCPYPIVGQVVGPAVMAGSCPGHARLGQTCPAGGVPVDPTLNCQRDARGNAVCSNGMYFPPGCPKTPPEEYFSPGIAPDEVQGTILQAKVPPPRGTPGAPPLVGGGNGGAPAAAPGYSGGTNLLPYAAGAIAGLGLLYAIFR